MEKTQAADSEKGKQVNGNLRGHNRNGSHHHKERGKMLVQLFHRKDDRGNGRGRRNREARRGATGHHVSAPALMLFGGKAVYHAISNGSAQLYARPLGAQRKPAEEGHQGRKRKDDDACPPSEIQDSSDRGHGGGNSAASAAVRSKIKEACRKTDDGGAKNQQGQPHGIGAHLIVERGAAVLPYPRQEPTPSLHHPGSPRPCRAPGSLPTFTSGSR